jgi:hypothetical protein
MIKIKIGSNARDFENVARIDESWINQQINGLRGDGHSVCIRVSLQEIPLNMTLTTPGCISSGGGGRGPNREEAIVFELWEKHGLNSTHFQGGNLIAFFKQVRKIIGR